MATTENIALPPSPQTAPFTDSINVATNTVSKVNRRTLVPENKNSDDTRQNIGQNKADNSQAQNCCNPLKLINSTSQISDDSILYCSRPLAEHSDRDVNSKIVKSAKSINLNPTKIPPNQLAKMETLNSISKYNCVAPAPASNRIVYKEGSSGRGDKKKGKFLSNVDVDNKNIGNCQKSMKKGKNQSAESFKNEATPLLEDEEDPYAWGEFGGVGDLIIDLDANIEKSLNPSPKKEPNYQKSAGSPLVACKSATLRMKIKRKSTPPPLQPPSNASSSLIKEVRGKIISSGSLINNATTTVQEHLPAGSYNEIVVTSNNCSLSGNTIYVNVAAANGSSSNNNKQICVHKSMAAPLPPNTFPSSPSSPSSNGAIENQRRSCNIDKLVTGGDNYIGDNAKLTTSHSPTCLMNDDAGFKRLPDEHALNYPKEQNIKPTPSEFSDWRGVKASELDPGIKTTNIGDIIRVNVPNSDFTNINNNPISCSAKLVKQPKPPTPPSSPVVPESFILPNTTLQSFCNAACKTTTTVPTANMSPGLLVSITNQSLCLKSASLDALTIETSPQNDKTLCKSLDAPAISVEACAKDQSTSVEENLLGPCESGTLVNLNGVVWQENTASGMLVLNITWRGLNYVGTLMDTSKVKWAPPKLGAYHGSCSSGHKQHHANNAHHNLSLSTSISTHHNTCTSKPTSPHNSTVISQDINGSQPNSTSSSASSITQNSCSLPSNTFANCCTNHNNVSPSMAAYNMGGRVKRTRAAVAAAAAALASALAEATKTTKTDSSSSTSTTNSNAKTTFSPNACETSAFSDITLSKAQSYCGNNALANQFDHGLERCNFFLPQSNARRSGFSSPRQAISSASPAKRDFETGGDNNGQQEPNKRLCPDPQVMTSATTVDSLPDRINDAQGASADVKCPVGGCCKRYGSRIAMEFHLNRLHNLAFSETEWQTLTTKDEPADELDAKFEVPKDTESKVEISTEVPENSVIEPDTSVKCERSSAIIEDQRASPIPQSTPEVKSSKAEVDKPVSSPTTTQIIEFKNISTSPQTQCNHEQACTSQSQSGRDVIDPSDPFSVLLTDPKYRERMGLSLKTSSNVPSSSVNFKPNKGSGRLSNSADCSGTNPSQQQPGCHRLGSNGGSAKLTYQLSQDSLVNTVHRSQASYCSTTPFQDHLRMLQLQSRLEEPGHLAPSSFGHRTLNLHNPYYYYEPSHSFPAASSTSKLFPKLDKLAALSQHESFLGCSGLDKSYGGSGGRSVSPSCPRPSSQTPPGPYDFVTANEDLSIRLVDHLPNGRTPGSNRAICANAKGASPHHPKFLNAHQALTLTSKSSKSPPHSVNCNSNFSPYLMHPPLGCVGSMPPFTLHQQGTKTANYPSLPFPPFNNYPSPAPPLAHYFPGYPPMADPSSAYNGNQGPANLIPPQMMDPYMAAALFANQHETMAALAASGMPTPFYHVPIMGQHRPSPTPTPAQQPSSHHYNK